MSTSTCSAMTTIIDLKKGKPPQTPTNKKELSIFKAAMDTQREPKGQCPKNVRNRPKPQK